MTVVIPFNHLDCISGNTSDRASFTVPKKVVMLSSQASLYTVLQPRQAKSPIQLKKNIFDTVIAIIVITTFL